MSTDSHIPILPTNLGEHGSFISKCRDASGKIDPDAKLAATKLDLPRMKHKPTKEEETEDTSSSACKYVSNTSIFIIILVFVIILLILAIVWLVLKYNNLKKDMENLELKHKKEIEEKNIEMENVVESARHHVFMCQRNNANNNQSMQSTQSNQANNTSPPTPKSQSKKQTTPDISEVVDEEPSKSTSKNELENALKKLSDDVENASIDQQD